MNDEHEHEDEPPAVDMSRWSDAEFHRAAALLAWEAEQEESEGDARLPDYDR